MTCIWNSKRFFLYISLNINIMLLFEQLWPFLLIFGWLHNLNRIESHFKCIKFWNIRFRYSSNIFVCFWNYSLCSCFSMSNSLLLLSFMFVFTYRFEFTSQQLPSCLKGFISGHGISQYVRTRLVIELINTLFLNKYLTISDKITNGWLKERGKW